MIAGLVITEGTLFFDTAVGRHICLSEHLKVRYASFEDKYTKRITVNIGKQNSKFSILSVRVYWFPFQ